MASARRTFVLGLFLTLNIPMLRAESSDTSSPKAALGLKLGIYVKGLEGIYRFRDDLLAVASYDRKGSTQAQVESMAVTLRKVTSSLIFVELGLAHTTSYLYSPSGTIEVERGYLGGRIGLGVHFPFPRGYGTLRFVAFDRFLRETVDRSIYSAPAAKSLPGQYGELLTLSFGYFLI
ncbi:MAG: hypothetical protein M3Q07_18995 [Pseudobdellovibrionaceae bacterium]|nr:hypothetical protein [Pseudobdellovibrionaceae bacterium]